MKPIYSHMIHNRAINGIAKIIAFEKQTIENILPYAEEVDDLILWLAFRNTFSRLYFYLKSRKLDPEARIFLYTLNKKINSAIKRHLQEN